MKKRKYIWGIIGAVLLFFVLSTIPIWRRGKEVSLLTATASASHSVNSVFTKKANRSKHLGSLICKKCHPALYRVTCWTYIYFRDVLGINLTGGKNEIDIAKEEQIADKKIELKEIKNLNKELNTKKKEIKKEIKEIKKEAKEEKRAAKQKKKEEERKTTPF